MTQRLRERDRLLARRLILAAASLVLLAAAPPTIRLERPDDPRSAIEIIGLDPLDARPEALTVTTADGPADAPSLFGETKVESGVLRFRPRFPLEPGLHYQATLRLADGTAVSGRLSVPKAKRTTRRASVVRVSPSASVLPENLLRFYVEFSAPMSRGEAYDRVHLLDGSGQRIDMPFLELGEELWDPRGVRFTLLLDPGRIKNGLRPREEAGPVLEAGKTYTLVIDKNWRRRRGRPTHRRLPEDVSRPLRRDQVARPQRLDPRQARLRDERFGRRPLSQAARSRHARAGAHGR